MRRFAADGEGEGTPIRRRTRRTPVASQSTQAQTGAGVDVRAVAANRYPSTEAPPAYNEQGQEHGAELDALEDEEFGDDLSMSGGLRPFPWMAFLRSSHAMPPQDDSSPGMQPTLASLCR